MAEIKAEEDYKNYPLPIAYDFKSVDARERILYMNYNRVKADVDQLIVEVQQEFKKNLEYIVITSIITTALILCRLPTYCYKLTRDNNVLKRKIHVTMTEISGRLLVWDLSPIYPSQDS